MNPGPARIFRWDLDKTYLDTKFDTARELIRIAMEKPEDKHTLPGAAALMCALKSGPDGHRHRIEVLSGSPKQMRRVLIAKFRLDGVEVDGLTLKDNLKNLIRGRFRALRDQIGYKLPALLESRVDVPEDTREVCFGDDSETDAIIYRLYADLCGGRIDDDTLVSICNAAALYPDQMDRVRSALHDLPTVDPVDRILIHLDARSPLTRFDGFGPRVAVTFNAFQSALVLIGDGILGEETMDSIVHSMVEQHDYTPRRLASSVEDVIRRDLLPQDQAMDLAARLKLQVEPQRVTLRPTVEALIDYPKRIEDTRRWHRERARQRQRPSMRAFLFGTSGTDDDSGR
jgi:hypothetical protein